MRFGRSRFGRSSFSSRLEFGVCVYVSWRRRGELLGGQECGDGCGGIFRRRIVAGFINRLGFFFDGGRVLGFRFGGRPRRRLSLCLARGFAVCRRTTFGFAARCFGLLLRPRWRLRRNGTRVASLPKVIVEGRRIVARAGRWDGLRARDGQLQHNVDLGVVHVRSR
jgi:hypothetical protein